MYRSAKSTASSATNALKGLSNKIAQDAGNNVFGLPEYGLAAGQLASGNVSEALATLGVVKTLRGRGAAITANAAQAVGNIAEAGAKGVPPEAVRMSVQGLRGAEAFSRKEKEEGSYSGNGIQSLLAPSATSASAEPLPRMTGAAQPLSSDAGAYKAGLEAFLGGDTKTAKQEWQKALRLNPKNRAARNGLERLAAKDGKDPDAYKLK
jgi:TolA-binding protein